MLSMLFVCVVCVTVCICAILSREVTELVESRTHDLHSSLNKELQQRATRTELKSGLAELSKAADRQGLDVARLKRETGYEPSFSPAAAFADYVAWARRTTCWRETSTS